MGTPTTGDTPFCESQIRSRTTRRKLRVISLERETPGYSAKAPKHRVDGETTLSYTVNVKNITVSVDDETYRRARIKAAERATSLSALVRRFLLDLISEESPERGLERRERELRAQIRDFSAGDRLSREEAHQRHR